MSAWRRVATEKLPQFAQLIDRSESVGMLWIDVWNKFEHAHRDPVDEETIRRIYDFAWWAAASPDPAVSSATATEFFESLPTNNNVRAVLHRHMSREQFLGMVELFKYHLSPEDHRTFVDDFLRRRKQLDRAQRR